MGKEDSGTCDEVPSDLWSTNGGIYLGLAAESPRDPLHPLAGQEDNQAMPRDAQYRTSWKRNGGFNLYQDEGHVGTWGPQGSGKTRKLLLPNLLRLHDWSIYVVDIKGVLTAETALYRSQQPGHEVHVVDPFGVIKDQYPKLYAENPALFTSKGYNPLAALQPDKPWFAQDAKSLAMAMIQADEGRDAYWSKAAQSLTKGLLMALRIDKPGTSDALGMLRTAVGQPPHQLCELIKIWISDHGIKYPAIAVCLNEFADFRPEDRELAEILRHAKAQTDWLDNPSMQADLARKNNIDFASFKDRPQTCYVVLPPSELIDQAVWLRLMLTSALQSLLRSTHTSRVPVLFMLDECAAMGPMDFLLRKSALLRGFGIKIWTVWQSITQMESIYPKDWEALMGTAQSKITFTSGDLKTLEYFSRLSGRSIDAPEQQVGRGMNKERVRAYELAALDADEAVIFSHRGQIHRAIVPT